jgi:hypothetical protein
MLVPHIWINMISDAFLAHFSTVSWQYNTTEQLFSSTKPRFITSGWIMERRTWYTRDPVCYNGSGPQYVVNEVIENNRSSFNPSPAHTVLHVSHHPMHTPHHIPTCLAHISCSSSCNMNDDSEGNNQTLDVIPGVWSRVWGAQFDYRD